MTNLVFNVIGKVVFWYDKIPQAKSLEETESSPFEHIRQKFLAQIATPARRCSRLSNVLNRGGLGRVREGSKTTPPQKNFP